MFSDPAAVNYFHVAAVAPMLGYIAYENYNGRPLSANFAMVIALIAIVVLIFHLHLAQQKSTKIAAAVEGLKFGKKTISVGTAL